MVRTIVPGVGVLGSEGTLIIPSETNCEINGIGTDIDTGPFGTPADAGAGVAVVAVEVAFVALGVAGADGAVVGTGVIGLVDPLATGASSVISFFARPFFPVPFAFFASAFSFASFASFALDLANNASC